MHHEAAQRLLARMVRAQQSLEAVRLKPWADELMVLIPRHNPTDFAHLVHFLEALVIAFSHLRAYTTAQGTHEEGDVHDVVVQLETLAREARAYWEEYKQRASFAGRSDFYGA